VIIYIDPGYAGYFKNQKIPPEELELADIILITHFHKDHLQPEALSRIIGGNTTIFAPPKCADRISQDFRTIKPGDKLEIKNIAIEVTEAYNTPESNSTRKLHHKGEGVGYILNLNGLKIYHAGDTDFIPEMKEIRNIEIALLPIGGIFTMNCEEAVRAVQTIRPKIVIPMHMRNLNPEIFKKRVETSSESKVIPMALHISLDFNCSL
jgi:L-ascorbate metabolism protein UlaG (beta-lactamase superfamily)